MDYSNKSREELLNEINSLKERIQNLEVLVNEKDSVLKELEIKEENLDLSWAGNLGRWDWDVPSGTVKFNRKKVEVLGYDVDDFKPHVYSFTALIHPSDYEETMQIMRDHLQGKTPVYETEYRMMCKNGDYKWFYDRGKVIKRDESGRPLRLTGIVFDITERKRAEEKLRASETKLRELNATKDKFFSIIAHDLKNPFNYFLLTSDFLYNKYSELKEDNIKDYIKEINSSAKQLFGLLENLLQWSRANNGTLTCEPDEIDLYEIMINNILIHKKNAELKNIELNFDLKSGRMIHADFDQINFIVRNIISNAVKFTPSGGKITISEKEEDNYLVVNIKDTGIGIPEDKLGSLFLPGENRPAPGTNNEQGTGLGLILCHEFVKMNKGRLRIESEEGKGTEVYLHIPKPVK